MKKLKSTMCHLQYGCLPFVNLLSTICQHQVYHIVVYHLAACYLPFTIEISMFPTMLETLEINSQKYLFSINIVSSILKSVQSQKISHHFLVLRNLS